MISLMTFPLRLVFRRFQARIPAERVLLALFGDAETQVWLDSSQASEGSVSVVAGSGGPLSEVFYGGNSHNVFTHVGKRLEPVDVPADWPHSFALGWVGAITYEARHQALGMPGAHVAEPLAALLFTDRAVVISEDGWVDIAILTSEARQNQQWLDAAVQIVQELDPAEVPATELAGQHFTFDHTRAEYLECIAQAQEAIAAGDTYEVCLTTTASGSALADPLGTYRQLRRTSPVPYGAFLRFGNLSILSASPERFLKVDCDGKVSAKPIKGTRPRGATPEEDAALAADLASHPKDRAENLMIVDLLRNDLGRVCTPGSIRVPELFAVESFSHVHQLVSTIEGTLAPGAGAADLLAACFPGGSMTGAPKISTMDLIDALERRPRGFYSGAIGWLSPNGAADLSITIRTLVDDGRQCTFGVGGAIVADSVPEAEYEEILTKASALLEALNSTVS